MMRGLVIATVVVATSISVASSTNHDEPDNMYLGLVELHCVQVGFLSDEEGPAADALPAALRDFVRSSLPTLALRDDCDNHLDLTLMQPKGGCANINLQVTRLVRIADAENAGFVPALVWTEGYTTSGGFPEISRTLLIRFKDDYLRAGNKP